MLFGYAFFRNITEPSIEESLVNCPECISNNNDFNVDKNIFVDQPYKKSLTTDGNFKFQT